ncbi:MAG: response regulator transcription factor [Bacilli bacterium]
MRILVVDDEVKIHDLLKTLLQIHGYDSVWCTAKCEDVFHLIKTHDIECVLLDVMMHPMNGEQMLTEIKKENPGVAVLMVSADDRSECIVSCLEKGADDYVCKPFKGEELVARIGSVMRRVGMRTFPHLKVDETSLRVYYKEQNIELTNIEKEILLYLLKHKMQVLHRQQIIDNLWHGSRDIEERTIDSHIRKLRDKLRLIQFPVENHLRAVYGVGYTWE